MKTKILIVEDDQLIAFEIQSILNQNGFDADICDSFDSCIKLLNTFKPELILLDINLKEKHEGIQIGSYLISKYDIPFIYITGYTDSETLKRIQTTRPVGYLSKPLREIDVISNIELALYNKRSSTDSLHRVNHEKELNQYSKPVIRALEYIDINLNQEIITDELIRASGWSKFHFIREFAKEVGKTPYQYVFDKKMELAMSKLKKTNQSIKEISEDLGYNSNSSFSSAFAKHSGMSPLNYRKKHSL